MKHTERDRAVIVGADVGGTFTDLIGIDRTGTIRVTKLPTTPEAPGQAVVEGLEQLCDEMRCDISDVALLLHGTTVATNAVLQRRGAKTALLATKGFRDVLEIARQARPRLFDLDARRPDPLIPRSLRIEVEERIDASGAVVTPLDTRALAKSIERLQSEGVESVAICFLHSYANPQHERAAVELLSRLWPSVSTSPSSTVIPEYREYERASTTSINAFVAPVMSRYLTSMERNLRSRGASCALQVMQSNGGLMNVDLAARLPAATVLSGIAAGAVGGVRLARRAGHNLVLTLDMGGTSCDLALGLGGDVQTNRASEIAGLPIRLPALDVHTIGAGGGSIAYLDPGGALRVGPRSAGATPGPACYSRSGTEPTVTDANLILGRLPMSGLLNGRLPLNRDLAWSAVKPIADNLGFSVEEAAAGIIRVVNAGMARQMRVLTIERGIDPRDCSLVAFGGSGPAHAVELARELEIPEVIIPPAPGVTSAFGLLLSDLRHDRVQTVLLEVPRDDDLHKVADQLNETFERLSAEAVSQLPALEDNTASSIVCEVEVRYLRQAHELRITVPGPGLDSGGVRALLEDFDRAHRDRFGYAAAEETVLIVNALVSAVLPPMHIDIPVTHDQGGEGLRSTRTVFFDGQSHETDVVSRVFFDEGTTMRGPVIVEQLDTTTVVPPGASVSADRYGNLTIKVDE